MVQSQTGNNVFIFFYQYGVALLSSPAVFHVDFFFYQIIYGINGSNTLWKTDFFLFVPKWEETPTLPIPLLALWWTVHLSRVSLHTAGDGHCPMDFRFGLFSTLFRGGSSFPLSSHNSHCVWRHSWNGPIQVHYVRLKKDGLFSQNKHLPISLELLALRYFFPLL